MDFKALADRLMLNETEYVELLAFFHEVSTEDLKTLKDALAGGDTDTAVKKAHSLKGAAGNMGLMEIYETAKAAEEAARKGNLAPVSEAVPRIASLLDEIDAGLKAG